MEIRSIQRKDIGQVLAIYAPYIENTVITFEEEVPSEAEFANRMERITARYPWLVCEQEGDILGYAYASSYRERAAYDFDCELSVYVKQEARQSGVGSLLCKRLMEELRDLGYINVYSVITVPNAQSEQFHRKLGFKEEGRSADIGYKFGRWCSVAYLVKRIGEGIRDASGQLVRPGVAAGSKKKGNAQVQDCIFCRIASKEQESQMVYEDALCAAFLDRDPIQEGHILIIPKEHYAELEEVPTDTLHHILKTAQRCAGALKAVYHPDGCSVMQNGGIFNETGHFHLHIFPRYKNDGFGWKDDGKTYAAGEETAARIRRVLSDHE